MCTTSSVIWPSTTLRYGVSMKPNGFTRPNVASEPIRPMFGPSGDSIGHIRPKWEACTSRTSIDARSRDRPPGPRADRRRLLVTPASGLFWSMNWDSWEVPKNSLMVAFTGRMLIRDCGVMASGSWVVIRSRTTRSIRLRPVRSWFWISSPTWRIRRLPKWSISSTSTRRSTSWPSRLPGNLVSPACRVTKYLMVAMMSSRDRLRSLTSFSRPSLRLIL